MLIAIMIILILIQFIVMIPVTWQAAVAGLGLIQNRQEPGPSEPKNSFAILVCAHNEENAISALLDSLQALDYPKALYHTYVFCDHCTDGTAGVASGYRNVTVMERNDGPQNGKGDVLAWGLEKILADPHKYDAFTIFDADNVADPAFLTHMNESLNKGEDVIQGNRLGGEPYRSIITQWYAIYWACYSILFSYARQKLSLSCFLTGTGFTVRRDILDRYGWKTKSITEDVEFAIQHAVRNRRVSFNINAVCYDEQPSNFFVMLKQICRWCTGSYQILGLYFGDLSQRFGKTRSVKLLDNIILLLLGPSTVLTNITTILINIMYISTFQHARLFQVTFILLSLVGTYIMSWKTTEFLKIPFRKLLPGFFFFPVFLFFYTICSLYSLFFPTRRWHKIEHQGLQHKTKTKKKKDSKNLEAGDENPALTANAEDEEDAFLAEFPYLDAKDMRSGQAADEKSGFLREDTDIPGELPEDSEIGREPRGTLELPDDLSVGETPAEEPGVPEAIKAVPEDAPELSKAEAAAGTEAPLEAEDKNLPEEDGDDRS